MKIWECKIGEAARVPKAADGPMRDAVIRRYKELTGEDPEFIFSGWGATLREEDRAVVENREPIYALTEFALQAENARLTSEVARLREDAARYVWCRENGIIAFLRKGAEVDAMVDKEMAKPPVDCPF